jgi:GNAT superfamily N-acetyltransferase
MVYCPGNAADARLHSARCRGVGVGGGGGGAPAGGGAAPQWAALTRGAAECEGGGGGVRVLHLPPRDAPASPSGGAVAAAELLLRALGPASAPPSPPAPAPHYFVALGAGGALLGAACAHALAPPVARLLRRGGGSGGEGGADALVMREDAHRVRATLGVAQIWVAAGARRRGVARRLLDAARAHAVYAYRVPKSELAFSAPTGDGFSLALAYGAGGSVGGAGDVAVYCGSDGGGGDASAICGEKRTSAL